jgi:hypothetical protein
VTAPLVVATKIFFYVDSRKLGISKTAQAARWVQSLGTVFGYQTNISAAMLPRGEASDEVYLKTKHLSK